MTTDPDIPTLGTEITPLIVTPTSRDLVLYGVSTNDLNEVHYDLDYARSQRLDGVLVHGLLKLVYLERAVTEWLRQHGTVRDVKAQYRGIDLVGQPFRVEGTVAEVVSETGGTFLKLELTGRSVDGSVSTTGTAEAFIPARTQAERTTR